MEEKYLWSARNNAFFPVCMKDEYIGGGWDLSDSILVSDDVYHEFLNAAAGKVRSVGVDGMPCWVDAPPPSHAEQVEQASYLKSKLQGEAEEAIKPLERAKSIGIATEEELAALTEWERYSVFLMRVDTSLAPNIEWPQKPQ